MMLCSENKQSEANKLGSDYLFEIKFDGERTYIYVESHKISKIINRRGYNILKRFPEFVNLNFDFGSGIIDTEIIVVANGKDYGEFNEGIALRNHLENKQEIKERAERLRAKIMAFDILELNGKSLRYKPLIARKKVLSENIKNNDLIELAKVYDDFKEIWAIVEREHIEGVIAKHKSVAYESVRSKYWIKIKNWKEEVIEFDSYELAQSKTNPFYKGIILTNGGGLRCSCLGKKSEEVKRIIEETGKVKVVCQYLEKTKTGKSRFITFKEIYDENKKF